MNDRVAPAYGTLAWAIESGGNPTARERRSLLAPILRATVAYTTERLQRGLGLRPATLSLEGLRWPDAKLAREAERECRETVSAAMAHHSVRTFVFGLALAAGADAEKSARIAEGVALHVTPGIGFERGPRAAPGRLLAARGAGRPAGPCRDPGALRSVQPGCATRAVYRLKWAGLGTPGR